MKIERTYRELVQRFTAHLNAIKAHYENEEFEELEPLCIDTHIRKRIWLTFGGPNVWIDIILDEDKSEAISGKYEYRWGSESQTYELTNDECDEVAELYDLLY